MSKHTPEPWYISCTDWLGEDPKHKLFIEGNHSTDDEENEFAVAVAVVEGNRTSTETTHANANRIVACVNACAGINPAAVPKLVEALKAVAADVARAKNNNVVWPSTIKQIEEALQLAQSE